jgi:hypothetical protein
MGLVIAGFSLGEKRLKLYSWGLGMLILYGWGLGYLNMSRLYGTCAVMSRACTPRHTASPLFY